MTTTRHNWTPQELVQRAIQRGQIKIAPKNTTTVHSIKRTLRISGKAQPKEIPLKTWKMQVADELNLSLHAVESRLCRGLIKFPEVRRINSRKILVKVNGQTP